MPTYELQITGDFDLQEEIEFAEIVRNYGSGHDTVLRGGHSEGNLSFKLVYKVLSNSGGQAIVDPRDSVAKPPARYLWETFVWAKQNNAALNVKDPRTGNLVLCKFAERKLSYTLFAVRLFSSGISLKQYRALS